MASPARLFSNYRFGQFEIDGLNSELRKAGISLKLHPQPLRVLLLLIEHRGQIVTREEIQHCLWGDNTFVEFEGGINFCIKQVRDALADDVRKPRYIETLPRRGYRFIAPVTRADPRSETIPFPGPHSAPKTLRQIASQNSQSPPTPRPPLGETDSPGSIGPLVIPVSGELTPIRDTALPSPAPLPETLPRRWPLIVTKIAIAACSAIALSVVAALLYFHSKSKLTEKDTVVLADFVNHTNDPVFEDALQQALATELAQSSFLHTLPQARTAHTLAMMGRRPDQPVTPDVARELCLRTGSKALLYGSISSVGSHYLIELTALTCTGEDTLAQEKIEAANKDDVLKSLDRAASRLRTRLGESLPSLQKLDVPIEATTISLEALQNYSRAAKAGRDEGDAAAIPFLKRAIELDPNFAMAYVSLAAHYTNMDQHSVALSYSTKAYQLRDRVTDHERLGIQFIYFRGMGDLEKQSQILHLWMGTYPRDAQPHDSLGANYSFLGQHDKALAEWTNGLRLNPDGSNNYINLAGIYMNLDQLDKAQAILDQAAARKMDGEGLREQAYFLAFLRRDSAGMAREVAWAMGKRDEEGSMVSLQADTEAYYGHLNHARELSRDAEAACIRSESSEKAAALRAQAALRDVEFGESAAAKKNVAAALSLADGRDVKIFAALTLARAGDSAGATALLDQLRKAFPAYTLLNVYWIPVVNAAIALRKQNPSQALASLEVAAPYELGLSSSLDRGTLYPAYLRGEAFLMAHNGAAAAAEFQKLLAHPGLTLNYFTASLARLQLARAYVAADNTSAAKSAYRDFLTLWKDADPAIPLLREAQSEFALLK